MSRYLNGRDVSFWIGEQPTDITQVAYNELPRSSGNFQLNRTYTDDDTMIRERSSKDSVITGTSVSGDLSANIRLSDHYKKLRQGALQAYTPVPVAITGSLVYTHATTTMSGSDYTAIKAGDYAGFVLDSGDTVTVFASADGTATELLVAGLTQDETGTELNAEKYTTADNEINFMLQRRAEGTNQAGDTPQTYYRTFEGVEVFSYTQSLASESILTETYTMTGLTLQEGTDLPTQQPDVDYELSEALGSVKGVESIWFNGSKRKCFAQSLEFSIDNQGAENKAIGQEGACALAYGDPIITGSASLYNLKSDPYEFDMLADSQVLFDFAYVLYDVTEDKRMVVSGKCKATTVGSPPESGALITSLGLKFVGQVSLTYF
jgi:hypothetical protein